MYNHCIQENDHLTPCVTSDRDAKRNVFTHKKWIYFCGAAPSGNLLLITTTTAPVFDYCLQKLISGLITCQHSLSNRLLIIGWQLNAPLWVVTRIQSEHVTKLYDAVILEFNIYDLLAAALEKPVAVGQPVPQSVTSVCFLWIFMVHRGQI